MLSVISVVMLSVVVSLQASLEPTRATNEVTDSDKLFYLMAIITVVESFIVQAPGACTTKLFIAVIYGFL
jgi:hypothetical protein